MLEGLGPRAGRTDDIISLHFKKDNMILYIINNYETKAE